MSEFMSYDDSPEKDKEKFPTREEIEAVFFRILKRQDYKINEVLSNAEGVFYFDIEIVTNGERVRYNYKRADNDYRKPSLPSGGKFSASIHSIGYDSHGKVVRGTCVGNFLDGIWTDVPD